MMSLTLKGRKGDMARKRLALALAGSKSQMPARPKDAKEEKLAGSGAGAPKKTKIPRAVTANDEPAKHSETKYPLEERQRFGFSTGSEGSGEKSETLPEDNQSPVRRATLASRIPQMISPVGSPVFMRHGLNKAEQGGIKNSSDSKVRHSKAAELSSKESSQRNNHYASINDFVPENPSIKSSTSPEATAHARTVTQPRWSRHKDGNASEKHRKNINEPLATAAPVTADMDSLEQEVRRLKCDVHEMLEEFQDLRALAQLLEKKVKDTRRDRQQVGS